MKREDALRGEQVKFLYRHLPTALIINVLLSAIVVAVQSEVVEASLRFGWLAVFYSILAVRVVDAASLVPRRFRFRV
ncbi:MAG: hypothetical protein P8011_11175 [Acidihalobacter sp.]|uniref:hypothetical protein n=1 Tax=Acidihalobacter sp. TaxID=1872108 RepID=UPI00307D6F3D